VSLADARDAPADAIQAADKARSTSVREVIYRDGARTRPGRESQRRQGETYRAIVHSWDNAACAGEPEEWRSVEPLLAELHAPLGVFSVLGNHDPWADTGRSQHWLSRTGQDLRHKAVGIERDGSRLWLVGAGDLWEDHRSLDELMREIPESDCRLVLAHNPDTADTDFSSRVDLMVSGHTHGGQVDIPFVGTPILPFRNKAYSSGLKRSPRGASVFISRGIGWAVYPVRFNCLPEFAVLELVPAEPRT